MQIAFLTLFLGLVSGTHEVAVRSVGTPALVELQLDGRTVGRLTAPPWRTTVDFGRLRPHELVAIARDAEGSELARARQWLNLPRPAAEAQILLERDQLGQPVGVQLLWQGVSASPPRAVEMTLDGQPLPLEATARGAARAALGTIEQATTHLLSTEIQFENEVIARRDLAFGGDLGEETQSDLTALALRVEARVGGSRPGGRPGEDREELAGRARGWLVRAGARLPPVAAESGRADVVLVRELSAMEALRRLDGRRAGPRREGLPSLRNEGMARITLRSDDPLRFEARLERGARLRFCWPTAQAAAGDRLQSILFDTSRTFAADEYGVGWLLAHVEHPAASSDAERGRAAGQRFADATAVAGLQAAAGGRPRAVVLVLGSDTTDASAYSPAEVREYLAALRVPLYVWSLAKPAKAGKPAHDPARAAESWPGMVDVSNLTKLRRAVADLDRDLSRQVIVWVEGSHLPSAVELAPAALQAGVRFAGDEFP